MEAKFRPIPLTILDILAVIIPGFTWIILLITTFGLFSGRAPGAIDTPLAAWSRLAKFAADENTWFAVASLISVALVIGYAQKPLATSIAEWFNTPLLKLNIGTFSRKI